MPFILWGEIKLLHISLKYNESLLEDQVFNGKNRDADDPEKWVQVAEMVSESLIPIISQPW